MQWYLNIRLKNTQGKDLKKKYRANWRKDTQASKELNVWLEKNKSHSSINLMKVNQ